MMNQIQVFENAALGKIRVLEKNGQPWFIGKDVAAILGYERSTKAVQDHVDDEDRDVIPIQDSIGRLQNTPIINESGLYSLIFASKLPDAKAFKRWVSSEVLPSIRKHGAYIKDDILRKMRNNDVFTDQLLDRLFEEQEKNEELLDYVEKIAPKAMYCDVVLRSPSPIQTTILAKDYGMSAVSFNRLLHNMGIQYKVGKTWVLYQGIADQGFTVSKTYLNGKVTSIHTCWTERGRNMLYNLLKDNGILPTAEKITV